jgi:hypothetical protein
METSDPTDPSLALLRTFFATSPAARRATRHLARAARVDLALDGGPAHFTHEEGRPEVRGGGSGAPDFTLVIPRAAVERLTEGGEEDVGELGIRFLELARVRDPALRIRIHLEASTARLVGHGYLAVLALGGVKVAWWLLRNGLGHPRAAIERLRRRSEATRSRGTPDR